MRFSSRMSTARRTFLGDGFGFFGQDLGGELVGWLVDQVAGEVLGFGDDAAADQALFAAFLFVGVASDYDGVDDLSFFLSDLYLLVSKLAVIAPSAMA